MSRGRKPRVERPEPSRKQLMAAAIDCFARLGYQGTTIDRIARDAGVTKGAVYYHFRDKEQLLFEAVKDHVGEFERQVLAEVTPELDAMGALRRVVDVCFFHATVSNHRRFIITLMVEALDTNPALSVEFRNILRRMRVFLADVLRRGQERGVLRGDVSAEAAAAVVAGGIMGARSSTIRIRSRSTCARSSTRSSSRWLPGWRPVAGHARPPEEARDHGELQADR